jgi:hypothetical protein
MTKYSYFKITSIKGITIRNIIVIPFIFMTIFKINYVTTFN